MRGVGRSSFWRENLGDAEISDYLAGRVAADIEARARRLQALKSERRRGAAAERADGFGAESASHDGGDAACGGADADTHGYSDEHCFEDPAEVGGRKISNFAPHTRNFIPLLETVSDILPTHCKIPLSKFGCKGTVTLFSAS